MEKFNPLGEKFIEAVHKKKAETEPNYKGENPGTVEEAIEDLKEMGVINEKEQKPFTEKDAEDIIKVALSKDVFKRQKPYVYREIDRLGKELVEFLKKARETKNMEAKRVYEERAKFFRMELEKAKVVRDKIKLEKQEPQKPMEAKIGKPTELQADIRETQLKNYGESNIYTKESTPEDALEEGLKLKNLRGIDKKNT